MIRAISLRDPGTWAPFIFFTALLLTGLMVYDDYGVSWDEPLQHRLSLATWDYISGKNNDLLSNDNLYLNPFIGLLEVLPEKILKPGNERAMYLSRHLFNFIFCWLGFIFFYRLALKLFRDYRYALLSCLLFILTPRLVAHCFYNSKDLPFLFLFVVNAYLFVSWLQRPSWGKVIWMVICSGMLVGARVAGLLFPVLVVCTAVFSIAVKKISWKEMKMIICFLLLYPVSVYIFFPTFWHNPVSEFSKAVEIMSHHPYEVTTFFMGETVHSLQTPWYYIPVWMGIIIPIGWWIFFLAGMVLFVIAIFRRPVTFPVWWILIIAWLLFPLLTEIMLHSSTYDDGRHLFFIYPPFLLITVYGIQALMRNGSGIVKRVRMAITVLIFSVTSIYISLFLIDDHPFQYAYFNALGRKYADRYFEKDYWGLSFRQALEFLVKFDKSDTLNVSWKVDPGEWNLIWLKNADLQRIHPVHYNECDYYLTNFRTHAPKAASDEKIYEVQVQGITIMAVYKMRPPNGNADPTP